MIASIIAYLLCAFCSFLSGVFLYFCVKEEDGNRTVVAFGLTFVFGIAAWGFAFLGGLS